MNIAEIFKIVGILSGIVLGIIGAVPQIIQWNKPKPHLVLMFVDLKLRMEEGLKPDGIYRLKLVLGNDNRFLRRTVDATGVKVEYHVIDMNHEQCGELGTFHLSTKLPIGESVNKDFDFRPECKKGFNPHTLILNIFCDEGQTIKYEIPFDCL